ncbi:Asp23/Gls24 family envelope stress response protein [Streptomyces sp. NPDC096934]|uniref:Asp23/Gls24 family envelope stress response protein n=1 Tax=Streptomyces sp. NPDC096934 TaxID=3155551 RepID=UPI00333259FD
MALDDHRVPLPPHGCLPGMPKGHPGDGKHPNDEAGDAAAAVGSHVTVYPDNNDRVAESVVATATRILRDRKPPSAQCLMNRVTALVRDEVWPRPALPLDDATNTLRITEHAASAALRHAADAVTGVTTASCRLTRADQGTGVRVSMALTAGLDRPLPETARLVRRSVVEASGQAVGMAVTAVDITVIDAHYYTGA